MQALHAARLKVALNEEKDEVASRNNESKENATIQLQSEAILEFQGFYFVFPNSFVFFILVFTAAI